MLSVYTRHSQKCPHRDDIAWRRCRCPKWIQGTPSEDHEFLRTSAQTRTWEQAEAKARQLEEAARPGARKPAPAISITEAVAAYRADVVLVSSASHPEHVGVRLVKVETAEQMLDALRQEMRGADLLVMAAAVADYRPARAAVRKIKREGQERLVLELEQNPDLLAELSREPGAEATFKLGFAAEDAELEERAVEKVRRKGLDAIVANDVSRSDIAFGSDFNAGLLIFRNGERHEFERITKLELADRVLDLVKPHLR